jgi:hypothetical protein
MPRGDGDGPDGLTVLRAHGGKRLTKRFTLASNGVVVARNYDNAMWFAAERLWLAEHTPDLRARPFQVLRGHLVSPRGSGPTGGRLLRFLQHWARRSA